MAYCVKCGVELERNLTACPLCNTPVYYREEMEEEHHKRYPDRSQRMQYRHVNLVPSKAFVYLMTFIIVIPMVVCLMIDFRSHHTVTWSFYPVASMFLVWILMAYPALMKRYSFIKVVTIDIYSVTLFLISLDIYSGGALYWSVFPVASLLLVWVWFLLVYLFGKKNLYFMFIIAYLSTGLYLYLIEQATKSVWFFELALPILSLILVFTLIVLFLSRFKPFKGIGFPGLIFFALSLFCIGTEFIINRFVFEQFKMIWSYIVAGVCIPVSIFLLFVQSNEEFRVYLQKKFHL
jgi:hypothetical protein